MNASHDPIATKVIKTSVDENTRVMSGTNLYNTSLPHLDFPSCSLRTKGSIMGRKYLQHRSKPGKISFYSFPMLIDAKKKL